jgi:hypothetical protein
LRPEHQVFAPLGIVDRHLAPPAVGNPRLRLDPHLLLVALRRLGYVIVGVFLAAWAISYVVYRINRYDEIEVSVG